MRSWRFRLCRLQGTAWAQGRWEGRGAAYAAGVVWCGVVGCGGMGANLKSFIKKCCSSMSQLLAHTATFQAAQLAGLVVGVQ